MTWAVFSGPGEGHPLPMNADHLQYIPETPTSGGVAFTCAALQSLDSIGCSPVVSSELVSLKSDLVTTFTELPVTLISPPHRHPDLSL